uniref:G-protein coupled receptors family 1 profile domain-containing protein n=1 Tax=Anopheles culicifacies TaxID=139723 RepID=A0A182M9U2_9DIPT
MFPCHSYSIAVNKRLHQMQPGRTVLLHVQHFPHVTSEKFNLANKQCALLWLSLRYGSRAATAEPIISLTASPKRNNLSLGALCSMARFCCLTKEMLLVIVAVWITSAVYSIPKFIFVRTITNNLGNDQLETICIVNRKMFNSELFDIINFALLYLLPLLVMTILYSRIAIALWKSSRGLERHIALQNTTSSSYSSNFHRKPSSKYDKRTTGVTESQVSVESDKVVVTTWPAQNSFHQRHGTQLTQVSHSSNNVLRARRGVIRMLMVVVLTSTDYKGDSNFNALFTPLTFLVTYFNSGVNPLLYAFLSRNFRKGMRELLLCSFKKNKNKSLNQRIPLHRPRSILVLLRHAMLCWATDKPTVSLTTHCPSPTTRSLDGVDERML